MASNDHAGIRWILANAGKEPTGRFKELADRVIRTFPKPKPAAPKK